MQSLKWILVIKSGDSIMALTDGLQKNKRKYFRNTRNTFRKKLLGPHSSSIDEHGNVFVICYYGRTLEVDASGYASKTLADDAFRPRFNVSYGSKNLGNR